MSSGFNSLLLKTHVDSELHRWNWGDQVSHPHQIVGRACEREDPMHFADSAMPQLPHQRNRLQPAEAFLDPLPLSLAQGIAQMARGASINRTATASFVVLRHVRRHSQIPAFGHKTEGVESFVASYRHRPRSRNLLQHDQRRIALGRAVGLEDFGVDDQPVAILHQ